MSYSGQTNGGAMINLLGKIALAFVLISIALFFSEAAIEYYNWITKIGHAFWKRF